MSLMHRMSLAKLLDMYAAVNNLDHRDVSALHDDGRDGITSPGSDTERDDSDNRGTTMAAVDSSAVS